MQGRELGYSSFNVKLGYPQTPQYDAELVRMVRRFAPDGFHWADANTSYDLETALAMTGRGPRAKLVEFAGVGHAPMLMADDQIAVVRDFLLAGD